MKKLSGASMDEYKLQCMQAAYDVIKANPGITTIRVYLLLKIPKTTAIKWLRWLCDGGLVQRNQGKRGSNGNLPDFFHAIRPRPEFLPEGVSRSKNSQLLKARRLIVKACDCGMKADALALPREFFRVSA